MNIYMNAVKASLKISDIWGMCTGTSGIDALLLYCVLK